MHYFGGGMNYFLIGLIAFVFIVILRCIRIVPQQSAYVVER